MPAGTIALTNNSSSATGTGTSFDTELSSGDFLSAVVGQVRYTLGIKSVDSATGITLIRPFNGPSASGLAWTPIPRDVLVDTTAQIAADQGFIIRGFVLDKANWQQVYSGSGEITVTLSDGSSYTGPSWNNIAASLTAKAEKTALEAKADKTALDAYAKKGANGDITSLSGLTTALSISQGGTGATKKEDAWKNLAAYGNAAGTAAQGNDSRLNTVDGKSGGTLSSMLKFNGATGFKIDSGTASTEVVSGEYRNYLLSSTNSAGGIFNLYQFSVANQYTSCVFFVDSSTFQLRSTGIGYSPGGWQTYSDQRLKEKIKIIDEPISRLFKMRGYTFEKFGLPGTGVIAQEAQEAVPQAVSVSGDMIRPDTEETIKSALSISPGDLVGLLIEVCRNQEERIARLESMSLGS